MVPNKKLTNFLLSMAKSGFLVSIDIEAQVISCVYPTGKRIWRKLRQVSPTPGVEKNEKYFSVCSEQIGSYIRVPDSVNLHHGDARSIAGKDRT